MKSIFKLIGIIALITVICFSFIGCEEDGGGTNTTPQTSIFTSNAGGNTYKLTITEKLSSSVLSRAYAPKNGDSYTLVITGTNPGTSSGSVTNVLEGTWTLKPSNSSTTFGVTISGGNMTSIVGTITLTGGDTQYAPGLVTPGTGGNDNGNGNGITLNWTPGWPPANVLSQFYLSGLTAPAGATDIEYAVLGSNGMFIRFKGISTNTNPFHNVLINNGFYTGEDRQIIFSDSASYYYDKDSNNPDWPSGAWYKWDIQEGSELYVSLSPYQ